VLTDDGPVPIEVPRDREGTFEPQLIGKHERRFTGFDDKVIALYARGLTVREIQAFLKEAYAVDVSPDLISAVTDAIVAEVTAWQSRPLEPLYPVVFFDALRVKIRDEATVRIKAVYLALAVLPDGSRDILGIWIEQTGGAAGAAQYHGELGAGRPHLAPSDESVRDPVRRSLFAPDDVKCPRAWTLPEPWTHRTRPPLLGKPPRTRFPTAPTRIVVYL
jgi:hypothetical protein